MNTSGAHLSAGAGGGPAFGGTGTGDEVLDGLGGTTSLPSTNTGVGSGFDAVG